MQPRRTLRTGVSAHRGGSPGLAGAFSALLTLSMVAALSACAAGPVAGDRAVVMDVRENMTLDDRHIAEMALQIAMERRNDNDAGTWTNGLSGNHGAVVPRRTYRSEAGAICRQYDEMLTVAGVATSYRRTACRDGSGRWTTVT